MNVAHAPHLAVMQYCPESLPPFCFQCGHAHDPFSCNKSYEGAINVVFIVSITATKWACLSIFLLRWAAHGRQPNHMAIGLPKHALHASRPHRM